MGGKKQLSIRQTAVLEDLFEGELDEQQVLQKHKLRRNAFNKWREDEVFAAEFEQRLAWLNRQSELVIAKYARLAASKLVQLTDSEIHETARKACLDIISLPKSAEKNAQPQQSVAPPIQLSDSQASRILEALVCDDVSV